MLYPLVSLCVAWDLHSRFAFGMSFMRCQLLLLSPKIVYFLQLGVTSVHIVVNMQADILCSVTFGHQNEQIWCSRIFSWNTSMFAYNRNSLCKQSTLGSVIFSRQNEQIWFYRVSSWKTSMLAYNRSSLCKQGFCVMLSWVSKMSKYDVLGVFLKHLNASLQSQLVMYANSLSDVSNLSNKNVDFVFLMAFYDSWVAYSDVLHQIT